MSQDQGERRPKMEDDTADKKPSLAKWQKVFLLLALGCMLVGGALWAIGPAWGEEPVRPGGGPIDSQSGDRAGTRGSPGSPRCQ